MTPEQALNLIGTIADSTSDGWLIPRISQLHDFVLEYFIVKPTVDCAICHTDHIEANNTLTAQPEGEL